MRVEFKAAARRELKDAARWYNKQHPALGDRFKRAIDVTLDRICAFPHSSPLGELGIRSAAVAVFPYVLWYEVHNDVILVYAVSHAHRQPGYWLNPEG
jgi:plasmid stabilization system protein ParE